jgi:hypothetical protein
MHDFAARAKGDFPFRVVLLSCQSPSRPDREPVLRETWLAVIEPLGANLVIGGKSLGGSPASWPRRAARAGSVYLG